MSVSGLSDKQLEAFIANYRRQEKVTGGKFSLHELLLEQRRRIKSPFPPREVAKAIVELAQASGDGLVSYKQVWEVFRPGAVWIGNAPRAEMAKALAQVIAYCVDNDLPLLSTLVVRAGQRSQSKDAIANICNEARSLGLGVGPDPAAFVLGQQQEARALAVDRLPADDVSERIGTK